MQRKDNPRLWHIWYDMKARCGKRKWYEHVSYAQEWESFSTFVDWALSSGYEDDLTIDRIDVLGNYEPSNCRWITKKEQHRNMRSNKMITYQGKTQCLVDWAEELGINKRTLSKRLARGWTIEDALSKVSSSKKQRETLPPRKRDEKGRLI